MSGTGAVTEWWARQRERREERRRKMKEHRDALRAFLRELTRICSYARELDETGGAPLGGLGKAEMKELVLNLEVAADQIKITSVRGEDPVLSDTVDVACERSRALRRLYLDPDPSDSEKWAILRRQLDAAREEFMVEAGRLVSPPHASR